MLAKPVIKSKARRQILRVETFHLWMICGGICSFDGCPDRLVLNTKGKLTNIGIVAHIIGHSQGGPRHEYAQQYGYTDDTLEDLSNLMLMCYNHSKLIDDHHTKDSFPPDLLFAMKERHESWVRGWTDEKKKSLAIVHKRLGPPMVSLPLTEQTSNILLEAIEDQTEFLDFSQEGWEKGKKDNEKIYEKFIERITKGKYDVAEVYAISPIPLLIHLGELLSDTIPLTVYQYERDLGYWVNVTPKGTLLEELNPTTIFIDNKASELVVTISISDFVTSEDVSSILNVNSYDQFDIKIENPHLKRLLYNEQIKQIQRIFKDKTEELIRKKRYTCIHLLYCGPAGLAIELGRSINPRMWPEIALYQFNYRENPRYHFTFTI